MKAVSCSYSTDPKLKIPFLKYFWVLAGGILLTTETNFQVARRQKNFCLMKATGTMPSSLLTRDWVTAHINSSFHRITSFLWEVENMHPNGNEANYHPQTESGGTNSTHGFWLQNQSSRTIFSHIHSQPVCPVLCLYMLLCSQVTSLYTYPAKRGLQPSQFFKWCKYYQKAKHKQICYAWFWTSTSFIFTWHSDGY